jgi:aromatic ring hydroxylase
VSGAKSVATAAAYADDILLWPAVPNFGPGDEPYALCCSIPIASDGLKVICRPSFTNLGRADDFPLSSRYDEMDSVVVFDRVSVPWDRVFLHGDIQLITKMYATTRVRELSAHQTNIRLQVKLEFIYALLVRMAQAIGVEAMPPVTISLGEAAAFIEIIRSAVVAGEQGATIDPENGVLYPDLYALQAGRALGPVYYPELVGLVRRMGGGALAQWTTPQLTRVDLALETCGRAALDYIAARVAGSLPADFAVEPQVVRGQSVALARGLDHPRDVTSGTVAP